MKTILLVAALAIGCGNKSDKPEEAAGPTCADAIAKAVDAMPGGASTGEVQGKLKAVMTMRCTEDKWPAATLTCYATEAKDMATMKKCRQLLPADMQQKLMTEIRAVMMGAAAAGGGGPMHGAPSGSAAAPSGSAAAPAGSAAAPAGSAAGSAQ